MNRKDPYVVSRILSRIDRAQSGNFGDYKYLRAVGVKKLFDSTAK